MRKTGLAALHLIIALAALLAAPAARAQARAPEPVYRELKQWILGCDNTRRCTARFVRSEFAPPAALRGRDLALMSVTREGGATGALTVRLSIPSEYDEDTRQKTLMRFDPARLQLDGQPLAPRLDAPRRAGPVSEHVLTGPAALQFLITLQGGSLLALTNRPDSPLISLEGLTEALVAMDQAQGRANNQSALIHGAGAAPASATPPGLPAPLVKAAPAPQPLPNAAAIAAQVRGAKVRILRQHGCDLRRSDDVAARLNEREVVILLKCNTGAYQGYVLAFRATLANLSDARILRLPWPGFLSEANGGDVAGEYGTGAYDPSTATFSQTGYGRGIGDCGTRARWVFDGKDFHLAELNYQDRCGGVPEDWLTLYRTRVLELP